MRYLLAHAAVAGLLLVVAATSCVQVLVEGGNYPTVPASDWSLWTNLDVGYALTLQFFWSAFDLNTEVDKAVDACWSAAARDAQRSRLSDLHTRGVRLFVCDTRKSTEQVPIGYAVRAQLPTQGLDAFLDESNTRQPAGRTVVDKHHANTNAGDMVIQLIRERVTLRDGSTLETSQYQFYVVRFGSLHFFFVELPTALDSTMGRDADLLGKSFTPTR